jgi:hypothetical protein
MNSILDPGEETLSPEELAAVQQNSVKRLNFWRRRALYSIAALFVGCASVVPFLAGHSLHEHAEPFARLLVLVNMGLFTLCVYYCLLWWGAWSAVRALDKG